MKVEVKVGGEFCSQQRDHRLADRRWGASNSRLKGGQHQAAQTVSKGKLKPADQPEASNKSLGSG